MKFFIVVGIILLNTLLSGNLLSNDYTISGNYNGVVYSGDDFDDVITTFYLNEKGLLAGKYRIQEEDGETFGELTDAQKDGNNTYIFRWKDKYGSGALRILFASDYQIFLGYWGDDKNNTTHVWNGMKK